MIVVNTPNGQIGSQLVPQLLAAGEKVRVIARDPSKVASTVRDRVEVVHGSADDPTVLDSAFAGAESVFYILPPAPNAPSIKDGCLRFARPAAAAIEAQGVRRVVAVSCLGRDVGLNAGAVAGLYLTESVLQSTGVDYRSLWCPGFMENTLGYLDSVRRNGTFALPVRPDLRKPEVATRDIAAMAARLLLDRSWFGQSGVAVLGPENLSFDEMATTMSDALGVPVRYRQIPSADYAAQLRQYGLGAPFADGLAEMWDAINDGLFDSVRRTERNTTPTSFRWFCDEVLKPAFAHR